jgi:hypothetical protein
MKGLSKPVALILSCVLLIASSGAHADDGQRFTSASGGISFWTPLKPRITVDEIPGKAPKPYKRIMYAMEGPHYLLIASELDLANGPDTTGDEQSFLDSAVESMRAGLGDKFRLDANGITPMTLAPGNLKGMELRARVDGVVLVMRSYVGRRTIYTLQANYMPGDEVAGKIGKRFLESLAVNDK